MRRASWELHELAIVLHDGLHLHTRCQPASCSLVACETRAQLCVQTFSCMEPSMRSFRILVLVYKTQIRHSGQHHDRAAHAHDVLPGVLRSCGVNGKEPLIDRTGGRPP